MKSNRCTACLVIALAASACRTNSAPTSETASAVPPDLRDVERDGDRLVATVFGAYDKTPTISRRPDWTQAASLLALLKQVWAKSKSVAVGLPPPQVNLIDSSIAELDQAIGTKDQRSAVFAANAVGLAVPSLFGHFHPGALVQIVRLGAVFRRVGIDAHLGMLDAAARDVSSLNADWAASKAAVEARLPTCHRVANTDRIALDMEQSLSHLATAISQADAATFEVESDNGARQVATLEELVDCAPDGALPD